MFRAHHNQLRLNPLLLWMEWWDGPNALADYSFDSQQQPVTATNWLSLIQ